MSFRNFVYAEAMMSLKNSVLEDLLVHREIECNHFYITYS